MTEEPYRWLEAMQNRRDYVQDQLRPASPVVLIQGEPGLLLLTVKAGSPKLFEIYDHLALGGLGHPADLEKIRQAAIDTAHLEGFTRSPRDVSARRLAPYAMAPVLKTAFEQIFASPLLLRALLVELSGSPEEDQAWMLDYDGAFSKLDPLALRLGDCLTGPVPIRESWHNLRASLPDTLCATWPAMAQAALRLLVFARETSVEDAVKTWSNLPASAAELLQKLAPATLECARLVRADLPTGITFQSVNLEEIL